MKPPVSLSFSQPYPSGSLAGAGSIPCVQAPGQGSGGPEPGESSMKRVSFPFKGEEEWKRELDSLI